MHRLDRAAVLRFLVVAGTSLIGATIAVGVLQDVLGVPNPSSLYLLAVVATAVVSGPWGAAAAAAAAFLLYNFLFVEPRYTLSVAHLGELVNLFLLLFVGFVVGQLAARLRARAEDALAREREALAQFQVSRELATRQSTAAALTRLAPIVGREAGMQRVWIALGDGAAERTAADTLAPEARPVVGLHNVLQRMPGDTPARWVRVHMPTSSRGRPSPGLDTYRVRIEAGGDVYGSIWSSRPHGRGEPTRTESRLLAAAADQIGQALHQDRLAAEAQAAEVAREGDAIKSALLQSVSHDLRTPLATIRAAAGTLRPGVGVSEQDQRASADAIDREVEYLNRLVTNLLDLSRIEAGALRAEREVFELDDLVGQTIARLRARLGDRPLDVALDVPPVSVDPIFLDEAVTNILENAVKYTPPGTRVRVAARTIDSGSVRLTIEDAGPGVPPASLDRLFEKFYRVPGQNRASRSGTGIGLAVVRGLTEAMGGRAVARPSELGGLAVDLDLVQAPQPTAAPASPAAPEQPE
jgi:two-component system sensor histidine kinase KdpD